MTDFQFKKTFLKYNRQVYSYVYQKTKCEFISNEVVQLTFIKLWENRNKMPIDVPINKILFQIARTSYIDLCRKIKSIERVENHYTLNKSITNNNTHDYIHHKELSNYIHYMVSKMPPMRAKVFTMSRVEFKTHKEIAELLSISVRTVENHIQLALKILRNSI